MRAGFLREANPEPGKRAGILTYEVVTYEWTFSAIPIRATLARCKSFSPPCEGGARGGYPGTTNHGAFRVAFFPTPLP